MNKRKYLLALSSILVFQSLSTTCISAQKLLMPEHPSVYKHQIRQNQSNDNSQIKNINQTNIVK